MVIGYDKNILIIAFYDTASKLKREAIKVEKPADTAKNSDKGGDKNIEQDPDPKEQNKTRWRRRD